ncbi:MAG: polymer-forming cytoskeletal protein, partial [Acidobacteria bacterium]|nr:polymer-forming cytoskeletal protein [Acidobacteriota bacterium]
MWGKPESSIPTPAPPAKAPEAGISRTPVPPLPDGSWIGQTLLFKAQISGDEDLYVDGEFEGSIELRGHNVTVGPNGKVNASVVARNVDVHGSLRGNVQAAQKVEIRSTGSLLGDLTTAGVTIEDGAYFKGSIDIVRAASGTAGPVS